jgi:phosphoribosylaminoimidazole (AIR) synthetase
VVAPDRADEIARILREGGETVYRIGHVVEAAGSERVQVRNMESSWRG